MTMLDRRCDRCRDAGSDVGWGNETLCLPCFLDSLSKHTRVAADALRARNPRPRITPTTVEGMVYRQRGGTVYHREGVPVYGEGELRSACGKLSLEDSEDLDAGPELEMGHRAKPCRLCFTDADQRHIL